MPELPEVETVRAGLEGIFGRGAVIARVELRRRRLRSVIPARLPARLAHQPITGVRRRAKYLLIDTPRVILLCHLGMTGSWRLAPPGNERRHDHCYLHLADGRRLAFHDPRRFGLLALINPADEADHPLLGALGPEPLNATAFNTVILTAACRGRRTPIKALLLDQRVVAGLGNIYAQEALFGAGIRPTRPAGRLSRAEVARLVATIRRVLRAAIAAGGTTVSDFRQAGGGQGHFQRRLHVYGRAGQPCHRCDASLRGGTVGGRGTCWCPKCQS
jgi:formamidopyrimidine-DNA glycosylase